MQIISSYIFYKRNFYSDFQNIPSRQNIDVKFYCARKINFKNLLALESLSKNQSERLSRVIWSESAKRCDSKGKINLKFPSGIINKKSNEVEVEHLDHESYLAAHAYSLAERRAFSLWLNNHLSNDEDCKKSIPINVESEALFSSLADGIVLCKGYSKDLQNRKVRKSG